MIASRMLRVAAAAAVVAGLGAAFPRLPGIVAKLPAPSTIGVWSPVLPWPIVAINTSVLPDGRLLVYPRNTSGQAKVWNPATSSFADATITRTNIFCSGHAFLGDGRLLVAGGHVDNGVGLPDINIFQPATATWSAGPNMNAARWYPSVTPLASGDALITSGQIDLTRGLDNLHQVFQMRTNTLRDLTGAVYTLPLYPFLHQAPNGKVFNSGPNQSSLYFDIHGTGTVTSVASTLFGFRDYGTSVMYEPGKVLIVGGHDPPTATAEVIDLNAPAPAWRYTSPMRYARRQLNATVLPDGRVLVTGGTSSPGFNDAGSPVFAAEVWNPRTETWDLWADMSERRLYHSTAVLLPDGRVLSAGGGQPVAEGESDDHLTAQILSPPYLFRGKRPTILDAPATVHYGERLFVTTPDADQIRALNWIRLPSTTHAIDMNQRFNELEFSVEGNGLLALAPSSPAECPPGDYMMFALNGLGVPSIARMIRIAFNPQVPPAAPTALTGVPGRFKVSLAWSDAGWNETGYHVERSGDGGSTWTRVAAPANDDTQFVNTNLTHNWTYRFRVRAYNAAGVSAWTTPLIVTTLP